MKRGALRARRYGARVVGSSYNEPLITAEWAVQVFKTAQAAGLRTAFISNGNATREALEYLRPWTDCYKVDLKSMQDIIQECLNDDSYLCGSRPQSERCCLQKSFPRSVDGSSLGVVDIVVVTD